MSMRNVIYYYPVWEDEMNGFPDKMKLASRNSQVLSHVTDLAASLNRHPRDVVLPFFARIEDPRYRSGFEEAVQDFIAKIQKRAIDKRKEMDAQEPVELEGRKIGPRRPGPRQVFETLPESMQEAFEKKDTQMLQVALEAMEPEEAKKHMDACARRGSGCRTTAARRRRSRTTGPASPLYKMTRIRWGFAAGGVKGVFSSVAGLGTCKLRLSRRLRRGVPVLPAPSCRAGSRHQCPQPLGLTFELVSIPLQAQFGDPREGSAHSRRRARLETPKSQVGSRSPVRLLSVMGFTTFMRAARRWQIPMASYAVRRHQNSGLRQKNSAPPPLRRSSAFLGTLHAVVLAQRRGSVHYPCGDHTDGPLCEMGR